MKIFRKSGISTLINIIGMSIAFAAAMILLVQVRWDTTYDANFEGHERVYRMESKWMAPEGHFQLYFCRPVIELARTASPNIEAVATVNFLGNQLYHKEEEKDLVIYGKTISVDSSLFSVFPFEWVEGSAKEFTTKGNVIISDAFAKKFFGNESAIGKILQNPPYLDGGRIVGVFKELPLNSSIYCDIIENIGNENLENADEFSYNAFIKLNDPTQIEQTREAVLDAAITYFGEEYIPAAERDNFRKAFRISNLHKAHYERDVVAHILVANKAITITLAAIAILLIFIAIINFINFAFAEIPFRIKSINTRKVLGEGRNSLIGRQLLYAGTIALIAFAFSCLIMHFIAGTSWASYVSDSLAIKNNIGIIALMLGIVLISAIAAGVAPALYSTSQPASVVLKGSYAMSVKGRALRNLLVGLQFVLSFLFILTALFVRVQTNYMMDRDMGFTQENVLQVDFDGGIGGKYEDVLEDALLKNPAIKEVTFAMDRIVQNMRMTWGRRGDDGKLITMEMLPVAENFIDFFGLQIVEGRDFQESDNEGHGTYIVNEEFMEAFPNNRVGSKLEGHTGPAEIVGVVKDFNFKSLQHPTKPLALYNWGKNPWRGYNAIYVRMAEGADFKAIAEYIKEAICSLAPNIPSDWVRIEFLDESIEKMYKKEQSLGKLITIASFVALIIAIIGIIGLVFFETQFIRKEIAVRRVNGASVGEILRMINKKYLLMALVSFAIAAPIAYWIMIYWRQGFAYQATVPWWIFGAAVVAVAVITTVVVILQSYRAANANPVESLKNE